MTKDKVALLAEAIYLGLEAEFWGSIEPETFLNVAEDYGRDDLYYDKISAEEAWDGKVSMRGILERALARVVA